MLPQKQQQEGPLNDLSMIHFFKQYNLWICNFLTLSSPQQQQQLLGDIDLHWRRG